MLPVSKWTRTRSLLKLVDEGVHLAGRHQVAVEEDVLDVQVDAQLLGQRAAACRRPRGPGGRRRRSGTGSWSVRQGMWTAPGTTSRFSVPRSWAASIILPASSRPRARLAGSLLGQRVGPEQERAEAADRDADLVGHLADRRELLRCRTWARGRFRGRSSARCRRSPASLASCRHSRRVIRSG